MMQEEFRGFNPEGYDFSPMSLGKILMPFG